MQQQQPFAPQQQQQSTTLHPSTMTMTSGTTTGAPPSSSSDLVRRAPKIDPNQMPSPAKKPFPQCYEKRLFQTCSDDNAPPSTSRYTARDDGNANPRFLRASLGSLPTTKSLLDESGLLMGALIQPLAQLDRDDYPNTVPVVNFEQNQVVRCNRCLAYVNPFFTFVNNGKQFVCNFCDHQNEVERWYMCNLDGYGKRRDLDQRPELSFGSVDLIVSNPMYFSDNKSKPEEGIEFQPKNIPAPLSYVFVIDVSNFAQSSGIVSTVISNLKQVVRHMASSCANCRVSFITFGSTVHFYNIKNGVHPQIMVVGDIKDVFLPFPGVNMMTFEQLAQNEDFLDKLVYLAGGMKEDENAMGSAIIAASELLAEVGGGRIVMFSSRLPTVGQGVLKAREDFKVYGTTKEKALFAPLLGFYKNFATTMAKHQICLDLFLFPTMFMESATLGHLTSSTGGHLYLYNNFNQARDSQRMYDDLYRNLTRETGYDAVLKVRTSQGLSLRRNIGNYYTQVEGDMDLAGVDADTAFAVELKHDSKLNESQPNYIQAAMLYTARDGTRRVRVHTIKLGTSNDVNKLFKKVDLDATLGILSRLMAQQVVKNRDALDVVRQMANDKLIAILASYRKNCSSGSNSSQLILPDALKLFPVHLLGLMKTPAFRQGTDILIDERIVHLSIIQEMGARDICNYTYPRLFNLTHMEEEIVQGENQPTYPLPSMNSLSASRIDSSGIYLLNDSINTYIWIGREAPTEALQALFNVDSVDKITLDTQPHFNLETPLGVRYAKIFNELKATSIRNGHVRVIRDRDPSEHMFFARLIEDKTTTAASYVDYLCNLHKDIHAKLS